MTPDQKHDYWRQHFESWQQSQLSQREYCKKNNLSLSSFGYWRKRLNRKAAADNKWGPVNLSCISYSSIVGVFLPAGIRLEVPADTLTEILPIIYRSLQEQS